MEKRCSKCGVVKAAEEFNRRSGNADGLQVWCRDCANAAVRNRPAEVKRGRRQRWKAANREKYLAHKAVAKAVARGSLVRPGACSRCGAEGAIHAHHADYAKRFDVQWLCVACHADEHSQAA